KGVEGGKEMMEEGGEIIDIGGVSTGAGEEEVEVDEEMEGVIGVVEGLGELDVELSVDRFGSEVGEGVVEGGVRMINEEWGGRYDEKMFSVVGEYEGEMVLMENGEGEGDEAVMDEMMVMLVKEGNKGEMGGMGKSSMWMDGGIGFGKRREEEGEVMGGLDEVVGREYGVLVGSRGKGLMKEIVDYET
ncbi:dihydropteroate synthase, partial [Staphylococcus auricularis]|uniref:dihydropteroate synthase n=1 Tax=Staphylococcus auricularis TaxID=29379 RepID=UPI0012452FCD